VFALHVLSLELSQYYLAVVTNANVDIRRDSLSVARHDTMRSGAERIRSPLVSFNHVSDPHFVTFSSSLCTTIRNPNPHLTLTLT